MVESYEGFLSVSVLLLLVDRNHRVHTHTVLMSCYCLPDEPVSWWAGGREYEPGEESWELHCGGGRSDKMRERLDPTADDGSLRGLK